MKRWILLLLVLCLALPACAVAEEKLPRLAFICDNYAAYTGREFYLQLNVRSAGSLESPKVLELRDQNGRVWASKEYKGSGKTFSYRIQLDESHLGGYNLAVWCGDTQVSTTAPYVAVIDRSQKVIQTLDTQEPYMSITLDCAYFEDQTDEILQILDEFNIKCTFFMTGHFVKTFPESAKKIRDAGHEIACHSLTHPHMLEMDMDARFRQVRQNVKVIMEDLGVVPRLFRPPFGEFDSTVTAVCRAEGMEVCMWTIDSMDWDHVKYDEAKVYKRVTKNITPGTVILFHLDGRHTPAVLRQAIPYYQETLGLNPVPVTELMSHAGRELPASPYVEE